MADLTSDQHAVLAQILNNPNALWQLGMAYQPTQNQWFADGATYADPFAILSLKKLLGGSLTPNERTREDFGTLQHYRVPNYR